MIFPIKQHGAMSYLRADQVVRVIHAPASSQHRAPCAQIFMLDGHYEIAEEPAEVVMVRWRQAYAEWLRVSVPPLLGDEAAEWVEVKRT